MTRLAEHAAAVWARHAGGALPVVSARREVFIADGAAYRIHLVLFRRSITLKYYSPRTPRSVLRAQDTAQARVREMSRRVLAGEPLVQVGDLIPAHAPGLIGQAGQVRTSDHTVWKRAEGDERYATDELTGELARVQEYDWIAWTAGEWGGGWATTSGLLDYGPLTVMALRTAAGATP